MRFAILRGALRSVARAASPFSALRLVGARARLSFESGSSRFGVGGGSGFSRDGSRSSGRVQMPRHQPPPIVSFALPIGRPAPFMAGCRDQDFDDDDYVISDGGFLDSPAEPMSWLQMPRGASMPKRGSPAGGDKSGSTSGGDACDSKAADGAGAATGQPDQAAARDTSAAKPGFIPWSQQLNMELEEFWVSRGVVSKQHLQTYLTFANIDVEQRDIAYLRQRMEQWDALKRNFPGLDVNRMVRAGADILGKDPTQWSARVTLLCAGHPGIDWVQIMAENPHMAFMPFWQLSRTINDWADSLSFARTL